MRKLWRNFWLGLNLRGCAPIKRLTLVSGSDSSHARSLCNWLRSAARHEPDAEVVVYDLGLQPGEQEAIQQAHSRVEIRTFRFTNYPAHFNLKIATGQYAWKPAIIYEVAKGRSQPICWMDAGNLITQPLTRIRQILARTGFYSPRSQGCIRDWTHPKTLAALNFPTERLRRRNLNGACVAFDPENKEVYGLLEAWFQAALRLEVIGPAASDRSNHRQDQAVLSALFHSSSLSDRRFFRWSDGFEYQGFLTHQDVEPG